MRLGFFATLLGVCTTASLSMYQYMHHDFYGALGVNRTSTQAEIKRAYRKLSLLQFAPFRFPFRSCLNENLATLTKIMARQVIYLSKSPWPTRWEFTIPASFPNESKRFWKTLKHARSTITWWTLCLQGSDPSLAIQSTLSLKGLSSYFPHSRL